MPNQPKTQGRSIRVPDHLWQAVGDAAVRDGTTCTAVVVAALEAYLTPPPPQDPDRGSPEVAPR